MSFSPVFRQWKLGIGYPDTTVAALAQSQFRQNLLIIVLGLGLLFLGLRNRSTSSPCIVLDTSSLDNPDIRIGPLLDRSPD
jgi:hypothetical protein